ncbi:MAG: flippase [bacterium]
MQRIKKFLFHNTSSKQTVTKNTFWLIASEATGRLLKMGLIIYAARLLGSAGWGVFSYAISIGGLVMIFSDIGLGGLLTREIIQKKEDHQSFIATVLFIKTILLIISGFLIVIIGPTISHIPEANVLFPLIAVVMFFDAIRETGFSLNRAYEKMEWEMFIKTIVNGLILIIGILLIKNKPTAQSIAIAYAIGSAIGTIAVIAMLKKYIKDFWVPINIRLTKKIMQITWPFAFVALIGTILGNTDIYMLGLWKNADEIGLYASVQRIQQFILIIPSMIATATFPILSRLAHTDKNHFSFTLGKTISMTMLVGLPIAFGGMLLSKELILLIFGAGYIEAVPIMYTLMFMLIFSFPLISLSNAIFSYNKQRVLAPIYITGVGINIILNALLIPTFGATGSAVATLLSTIVITLLSWKVMSTEHSIPLTIKKILFSTILMSILILLLQALKLPVVVIILISLICYLSTLLLLKEPILKDLQTTLWPK